jgi:hypothetical protein
MKKLQASYLAPLCWDQEMLVRHRPFSREVIVQYLRVSAPGKRELFERMLAQNVYLKNGMGAYLPRKQWNDLAWEMQYSELRDLFSYEMADAWEEWAINISKEVLSEYERREAIRAMLGVLISLRNEIDDSSCSLNSAMHNTNCLITPQG